MEDSKERTAESEETGAWLTMPDGRVRWVPFPNQTTDGKPLCSDAEIAKMAKEIQVISMSLWKVHKDLKRHELIQRSLTDKVDIVSDMASRERSVAEGAIVSNVGQIVAAAETRQAGAYELLFEEVKRHIFYLQADARRMHESMGNFDFGEHSYIKIAKRMEDIEQFITAYRVDEQSSILKELAVSLSNVLEEGDSLLRRRLDFNVTRRFLIVMLMFAFVLQCVATYLFLTLSLDTK
ncbi:hypothetical protein BV25DRAFT_1922750 [Artomyces pyxidatus]|uniref:Uncharacterized protein n=1 Tax=Artomyces pyxidatus TaxID=48021 RepID=A0ACB8SD55_9AGAM|nr:hypothetical protein BV25DRAFT_1922750 [Artomyces pyxidatus]